MPNNVTFYESTTFDSPFSENKAPGQVGYNPIFKGDTFNGTDGDGLTKVIFAHESNATKDFYYLSTEFRFIEDVAGVRDTDGDETNDIHAYASAPVETTRAEFLLATGNNSDQEWDTPHKFIKPGSEVVKFGTTVLTRGIDYFMNYLLGHIRFATPPTIGAPINISYVDGDDGEGNVNVPNSAVMELKADFDFEPLWDLPHGEDADRGVGYEKDGIPVVVRAVVDINTTDPDGDAATVTDIDFQFRGQEVAGKI